jgi:hypothetical protein
MRVVTPAARAGMHGRILASRRHRRGASHMKPSEMRDELLSEHAGLRERLETARRAVGDWAKGGAPRTRVRDALAALADALRSHNRHEERSLRDLVRAVDAWGPVRVEIMEEAHIREHRELFDALIALGHASEPHDGARELEAFRDRFLAHMAREEAGFLNSSVLRDDDVSIDVQDG